MCSTGDSAALPTLGCPIRESTGQRLFSASPWLLAAVHALLRLLVPRHPPCALNILTVILRKERKATERAKRSITTPSLGDTRVIGYCAVFKVREEAHPRPETRDEVQRAAGGEPV